MSNDPVLKVSPNILQGSVPLDIGLNSDINVSTMTVGMYEVMFHHHFEKSTCPNHSDSFIKFVRMFDVKGNRKTLRERLNKDLIIGLRIWNREFDVRVVKDLVEFFKVFCFQCKVDLIDENFFQRFILDRDLEVI
jgi:hypothetical protein